MNGNVLLKRSIDDQRRVISLSNLQEKHSYGITSIIRTFISMQPFRLYYPKGICSIVSQFKLLKVLDVLSIDDDFSRVIPQLVHLRYVAARIIEYFSLSKLRNLQTIILQAKYRQLLRPLDIWTMSEIRYLDIDLHASILHPFYAEIHSIGEQPLLLNNLHTLFIHYCNFVAEFIRRTPNLRKLKIIDGSDHPNWPDIFGSLNLLEYLETLEIKVEEIIDRMIFSVDTFPPNLKQLTLSYTCILWEDMKLLANLPNLEVLKGFSAFKGTEWKLNEDVVFPKLKYLRIANVDLQRWEAAGNDNFPVLEQLLLCGLHELEEIPESIGDVMTLKLINIYGCCSGVEISAKKIQEEQESLGNYELQLQITPMRPRRKGYDLQWLKESPKTFPYIGTKR